MNQPALPEQEEDRRAFFLGQTAPLAWAELAPFFARGQVVEIAASLDLIEVALAMVADDSPRVQSWMAANQLAVLSTETARQWSQGQHTLWALVVNPWVLVQARTPLQ
ncbi:DUF2288 domain-containing protein [Halothiobacillus sp. DCM-1]|uniref:DUF2288 domain-containing protein n=1 Tax=Halothiobacillus sp. DCM-1 TaxID=3112558 RepID=UPI0032495EC6